MTRFLLLSLLLVNLVTSPVAAQVYVRPSNGAQIAVLHMNSATGLCTEASCLSNVMDYSSFGAVQVQLATAAGAPIDTWLVSGIASYVMFNANFSNAGGILISTYTGTDKTLGSSGMNPVTSPGGVHFVAAGANSYLLIVSGIPFPTLQRMSGVFRDMTPLISINESSPVLLGGLYKPAFTDGGSDYVRPYGVGVNGSMSYGTAAPSPGRTGTTTGYGTSLNVHITGEGPNNSATARGLCQNSVDTLTVLQSNASSATPASPLASRRSILLCNSAENAGTPLIKCRDDGELPVMGLSAGQSGITLNKSDCVTYYVSGTWTDGGSSIHCITDTADAGIVGNECL